MIVKTVTFLRKTVSAFLYTTNQGMQVHSKWFD